MITTPELNWTPEHFLCLSQNVWWTFEAVTVALVKYCIS